MSGGEGFEGEVVAEGLELGNGSLASAVGVAADEVVASGPGSRTPGRVARWNTASAPRRASAMLPSGSGPNSATMQAAALAGAPGRRSTATTRSPHAASSSTRCDR